jgi:hypothetical protein
MWKRHALRKRNRWVGRRPMSIRALLDELGPSWISHDPPASETDVAKACAGVRFNLPEEYLDLLRFTNGAEATLSIDPWWFQLWSSDEAGRHNLGYQVQRWHPEYFAFGSSGGGVLFAFKEGAAPRTKVFGIPLDSMNSEDIYLIAADLKSLLRVISA